MPLYPPTPFGMSTIFIHANASGMYLSWNATCDILTNLSHFSVSGYFSLVASCSHFFGCSGFVPDGPPARPAHSFPTASAIYFPSGCPSAILTCCTKIGIGSLSLVISAYRDPTAGLSFFPVPLWLGDLSDPCILGTTSVSCYTLLSAGH